MTGALPELATDGFERHPAVARGMLPDLHALAATLPARASGTRLHGQAMLPSLLQHGAIHAVGARYLGTAARPVRAIMFNKTADANWSLGWHQDRTIAVRERREVAGFGPWTVKQGILHVAPPFAVIEAMITLRIHLDDVPANNAPLLVAPGSHRLGVVAEHAIADAVARCGTATCLAEAGDVWAYATSILHASAARTGAAHRRVLQVDYAGNVLPGGLDWLGL